MKFRESDIAHRVLNGLRGIEIGASAHNPFGLNTINIDINTEGVYQNEQIELCGESAGVDLIANASELPFKDNTLDFVLSSHVLEHIYKPIQCLREWYRVVKPGGYIFMIIPHKDRTFDKDKPRTTLEEIISRTGTGEDKHWNIWITEDVIELCEYLGFDIYESHDRDDKVGNGFIIIIKKHE